MKVTTKKYVVAFADIAGSTHLYETVGDAIAKSLIIGLQNRISEVVGRMGGQVQEIVGDEVMFRFESVDQSVSCACQIQETAEIYSVETNRPLSVRIGLHYGPSIIEEGRMFGDTVNTAARMVGIALGGQIITSEEIVRNLRVELRAMARLFDKVKVKGKQEALVVYDLMWKQTNVTLISPERLPASERLPTFKLQYEDQSYKLHTGQMPFTIGRNPENDLVVERESVSRRHASIEFNRGHFVLIDTSTNGTYVHPEEGESIYLRREALPLWGRGQISLGSTLGNNHMIHFDCG